MRPRRNDLHRINLDNGDHFKNEYPKGFVKVDIPEDNKVEMEKLKRSYARRTKWQSCWSAEYL